MNLPDLVRHLSRLRDPRHLGWPGFVGAGLLACGAGFHFSVLAPEQQRLDELRAGSAARAETELRAGAAHGDDGGVAGQLARFRQTFPPAAELPDWLDKLFAVAHANGMALDRGEYTLTRNAAGRLERIQISLPVRAGYPQVRKFIAALRAEVPAMVLDHIQFERQKVADANLEVTIKLALYMEPSP